MLNIFPSQEMKEEDELLLVEIFSHPTVEKYLRTIAYHAGQTIVAGLPSITDNEELYRRKIIFQQGQLAVLEILLSLKDRKKAASPQPSTNSN